MKSLPLPNPKSNNPAHVAVVIEAWTRIHYGLSDPRQAWRRIVGEQPTLAQLQAAAKEHERLYQVLHAYRPIHTAPVVDRAAIEQRFKAAVAQRVAKGMTAYTAMLDIRKSDRQLYAAYRSL